jgi:hypothetical protein
MVMPFVSQLETQDADSELYSAKRFFKAPSFKIGLLASLVVLLTLIVMVAIIAGVIVGKHLKVPARFYGRVAAV